MAKNDNLTDFLTDVADAIREKTGDAALINPQDFPNKIREIAGLDSAEFVMHSNLTNYLSGIANTLREVNGTSDAINPQDFSALIREISPADINLPLYVEAIEPLSVSFSLNPIEYSLDNSTWNALAVGDSTPTIDVGKRIYFRASGLTATSANGIGTFAISAKCELGGNAMSMIWGGDFMKHDEMAVDYNLRKLFFAPASAPNTTIINAERMIVGCNKVTTQGCSGMFVRCNALVKGCQLPATILANACYRSMYEVCANLEIGSDLPALNLYGVPFCYNAMYANCPKLRYVKAMFKNPSPNNDDVYGAQTGNWLLNVAPEGVFVKNKNASWSNYGSVHTIPSGWTVEYAE